MAKFLENLVAYRYQRNSLDALRVELDELVIADKTGKDSNIASQKKLAQIEYQLAKANQLYYNRKFQEALKEYSVVHALLHQMLNPGIKPDVFRGLKYNFVINPLVFEPLLKASLGMIEVMTPATFQGAFAADPSKIPADVLESTKNVASIGVMSATGMTRLGQDAMLTGIEYARRGEWEKSELFLKQALNTIQQDDSLEKKASKATLELNLGYVFAQQGKLNEAQNTLVAAQTDFKAAQDPVGEAKAFLNTATVLRKIGNTAEADKAEENSTKILKALEPTAAPATRPATTPAATVARPAATVRETPTIAARVPRAAITTQPAAAAAITSAVAEVEEKPLTMAVRIPGVAAEGIVTGKLDNSVEIAQKKTVYKQVGLLSGDNLLTVAWKAGENIDANKITNEFYTKRVVSKNFKDVVLSYELKSDLAVKIPQLYFYVLPVCLGDCYHHLGEYEKASAQYKKASEYQYINETFEIPSLWLKIVQNYLQWGNALFKDEEAQQAVNIYSNVIMPNDTPNAQSILYSGKLNTYGVQVAAMIANVQNAVTSTLNPAVVSIVLDVRAQLKKIAAGLDFSGFPANYIPIFKFDYLHSVAQYFAQQAVQAERQYMDFANRGENEQLTRQQLQDSVELGTAEVALAGKEVQHAQAELEVTRENLAYSNMRIQDAQAAKAEYADVSYEQTALDAASVFASGPEGYSVSYTYYSPSEGKNVTLSGSDAYKVMEDAAWRRGMLTRKMELDNMQRQINELQQAKQVAQDQVNAAQKSVEVALEQQKIAKLHEQQAKDMLASFESQLFTPEVWFQLAAHMRYISNTYLSRAIGVAKKMQKAYEFDTGEALNIIKNSYTTNILSGLLSADYLLKDIDYFIFHLVETQKSKDIPLKQTLSLANLIPAAFSITFKRTGKLEFETTAPTFDMQYPGSYLRKIKKVEVVIEGLLPPQGVTGTLKNSGISIDRKANGQTFYRVQPRETLFISQYNIRQDIGIFPPDNKVLGVFENCSVATSWMLELSPAANDLNYQTISDIKLIIYYTARHNSLLETQIKATLPTTSENSMALPFRLLLPDEYFQLLDTGELNFEIQKTDLPYNETNHLIKGLAVKIATENGTSPQNIKIEISQKGNPNITAKATTDNQGMIKLNMTEPANPLNVFEGKALISPWTIKIVEIDNPGFDRKKIKDLFLFAEYSFDYRQTA